MNASGVGVKVPEIYYAFQYKGQTHIVMEYVNEWRNCRLMVARLLCGGEELDLRPISQGNQSCVPSDSRPGPVGGGCAIQHRFFRDNIAPKDYDSGDELQRHINKVLYSTGSACLSQPLFLLIRIKG